MTKLTGNPSPLGATPLVEGVNFSVFAPDALAVDLLLFPGPENEHPGTTITLDPEKNCSGDYWHVLVPECGHGQIFAWRVRGPLQPDSGHLFDGDKVLLDPYARAVVGPAYHRDAAKARGDNSPRSLRGVVVDNSRYDWEGDRPLPVPAGREVIYEMHLAAFTASPSSRLPEDLRGTFAGCIERIPHLQQLGVTAVELLPVFHFDPQDAPPGLTNFWGYSSVSFFAPHSPYSSNRDVTGPVDEFRDLVKALHRAGIRVILDVVYNHTAEGGVDGPTLSWRGFANSVYYIQDPSGGRYQDFTGCGNTLNANHPVVCRLIQDSIRYWVKEMHVDGFRFDLASALTRDELGQPLKSPPVIRALESDPELAETTLIAEAWDAAGLYQVGTFPGTKFSQWNGPFRDDIRRFLRGDEGTIENLMARLVGSPDLFSRSSDSPHKVINFVTCHDGFSLADLVSYTQKHNLANGEENRDGSDNNLSSNHGHEGPSRDPEIQAVRLRQMKNFLTLLFLSHGSTLLLMGDETGHSRQGNNNPWCQDNELNWLNWEPDEQGQELLEFTRLLIMWSRNLPILQTDCFWTATSPETPGEITWQGQELGQPDWRPQSNQLAFTLDTGQGTTRIHVMLNAGTAGLDFEIPAPQKHCRWQRVIDTSCHPGLVLDQPARENAIRPGPVRVPGQAVVVVREFSINS